MVVEQPVHRDRALSDDAGAALRAWPDRPPLIIDESDGAVGRFAAGAGARLRGHEPQELQRHRERHRQRVPARTAPAARASAVVLTGEDLCNLGPVALLQDLAMMALLGIEHVERNGHHYYRGLSMWPEDWQADMLAAHGDLYARHRGGFAACESTKAGCGWPR